MRGRLYEQVQREILHLIQTNKLQEGDPLPPETELADRLGVSRLSVREATRTLQALGIIESRPGLGLFVKGFGFEAIVRQLPYAMATGGGALRELLQVRQALETALIGEARDRLSEAELDALDSLVDQMQEREKAGKEVKDIDRQFHLRIFQPLENAFLLTLIELFWSLNQELLCKLPPEPSHETAKHRAIVRALRGGGDPATAMLRHFDDIWRRLDMEQPEGKRRSATASVKPMEATLGAAAIDP